MPDEERGGERKKKGLSPEVARKILTLNPALRESGKDTFSLMRESVGSAPSPAPVAAVANPHQAFTKMEQSFVQEDAALEREITRLTQERVKLKERTLAQIIDWLLLNDEGLRSPLTQQVLIDHKPLLTRVGFTQKLYSDTHKERSKR